jgi:hypothetical protein
MTLIKILNTINISIGGGEGEGGEAHRHMSYYQLPRDKQKFKVILALLILTQLEFSLGLDGWKFTLLFKSIWVGTHWFRKPR